MVRINVFVDEKLLSHFKALPGTLSENIRRAMFEYYETTHGLNVSASQSKRGDLNG